MTTMPEKKKQQQQQQQQNNAKPKPKMNQINLSNIARQKYPHLASREVEAC